MIFTILILQESALFDIFVQSTLSPIVSHASVSPGAASAAIAAAAATAAAGEALKDKSHEINVITAMLDHTDSLRSWANKSTVIEIP